MTGGVVLCIVGGLLLVSAAIGGGFEVKELKIPVLSGVARLVSGATGSVVLFVGIGLCVQELAPKHTASAQDNTSGYRDTQGAAVQAPITFQVADRLNDAQSSEEVVVEVDGMERGRLNINLMSPHAEVSVTVPGPGQYSYHLVGRADIPVEGRLISYPGSGQGSIQVVDGAIFDLFADYTGDKFMMYLQRRPAGAPAAM